MVIKLVFHPEHVYDGDDNICTVCGYECALHSITFNYHNGIITQKNYREGSIITVPDDLSYSDDTFYYIFIGWDKELSPVCISDAEYTAVYESTYIDYTVKFLDFDGSVISEKTYHYGDKIDIPADPSREEDNKYMYEFAGWDKEIISTCTENAEYTAVYRETAKAILGDCNGDGSVDNKDVVALFRYVSGSEKLDDESVYDFNDDNTVDNKDVVALFRFVSAQ